MNVDHSCNLEFSAGIRTQIADDSYKYERDDCHQPTSFAESSDRNGTYGSLEDKLELAEQDRRDCADRFAQHIAMEGILHTTDD
jgi:hypothetical protein